MAARADLHIHTEASGDALNEPAVVFQAAERAALSHIDVLRKKPALIIHGDKDMTVRIWYSEQLYEKLTAAGGNVKFIRVPGATHESNVIFGNEDTILDTFK